MRIFYSINLWVVLIFQTTDDYDYPKSEIKVFFHQKDRAELNSQYLLLFQELIQGYFYLYRYPKLAMWY